MEGDERDRDDSRESSRELYELNKEWEHPSLSNACTFFIF